MSRSIFGFLILFLGLFQNAAIAKAPQRLHLDSLHKAVVVIKRHAQADSIRQNVVQVVFSVGYADSLLQEIEHLHTTLNNITNEAKYGFKTREIRLELERMQCAIKVINQSMGRDSTITSIKNLQLFRGLLRDMAEKLTAWHEILSKDNKELSNMSDEMDAYLQDSLTQKVAADTAFANLHLEEMIILNERWTEAQKVTQKNLKRIGKLLALVSSSYFDVTELQNKVDNELTGIGKKAIAKEYNYIWDTENPYSFDDVIAYTKLSISERMSSLRYYLILNPQDWAVILILGLIFFFWVFRNFRKIKTLASDGKEDDTTFKYIGAFPILSSIIFIFNLAPFYGFNQPAIYIEVLHLLILVPLTLLFFRLWPKNLLYYWCLLVGLSVMVSVMNTIITPGWPLRFLLLGLNLSSVLVGLGFLRSYRKDPVHGQVVKIVAILYAIMNLLAVFCNIAGRLTLAKILSAASIIAITQIIGLFVLISIFIEAFYIQMKARRIQRNRVLNFNYADIRDDLYQLLSIGAVFLWLIAFATDLEIYSPILSFLDALFNTSRSIGSTAFTIGNILTFLFVLYVVSLLQKYVGYFFGETEDDFLGDLEKKESRIVIFRLVIIMVGFFIAVVASGLPVDKVTVVLGALGVGIGLGLQNIVYNLVSGVILIFEKPMQIGDYIEVADKKGRVENIGIRASKLVTADGSEVIVPNGDILSSHMVNWTRSNNNRRSQLTIEIEPASELPKAKEIILAELKANHFVIQGRPVDILLNNLNEKSVEITINAWINSIYKEEEFKSELRSVLYSRLGEKEIKII